MSFRAVSDSPRITGLSVRWIPGRVARGQPVDPGKAAQLRARLPPAQAPVGRLVTTYGALEPSGDLRRWLEGHGTQRGTAMRSGGATAVASGAVCVLVHGRERDDGRRRQ